MFPQDNFYGKNQVNFEKSLNLIAHRGPNSSNKIVDDHCILGFNRLSIVSPRNGTQPIYNETHDVVIACNGEIFNHKELNVLISDHKFATNSDCETLLHLYEEIGIKAFNKVCGQFAATIYDKRKDLVVLARDRFGINPLYYAVNTNHELVVASEVKAMLSLDPSLSNSLDRESLKQTLFLYGPTPPKTCFENIFQVPPGHVMVFDRKTGNVLTDERYWHLPDVTDKSLSEITSNLSRLLQQGVKKRLQGQQSSLGVYLSGGLDSSYVSAITKHFSKQMLHAFSVTFNNAKYDESPLQQIVVRHLGLKHHSIKTNDDSYFTYLADVIWHTESPIIRTAPIPLYLLSRSVQMQELKYVLCGEGADEILLGYPVFREGKCSVEDKAPSLAALDKMIPGAESATQLVSNFSFQICKEFEVAPQSMRCKQLMEIYSKLSRYLLVSQGDRMSMSHGIEQRFPFLDEDVFDLLFSVPESIFVQEFMDKKMLRLLAADLLPSEIVMRNKQGYIAPMSSAMYTSSYFSKLISTYLDEKVIQRKMYFNPSFIKNLCVKFDLHELSESESIGLLFALTTQMLDEKFFPVL